MRVRLANIAGAMLQGVAVMMTVGSVAGCIDSAYVFQAPTCAPFLGRYVQKHYFRVLHPIRLQTGGLRWSKLVISNGPPVLAYEYCSTNQPRFHYPLRHDSDSLGTWTAKPQFTGAYQANMQVDSARQDANEYAQDEFHSDLPSGRYHAVDNDDRRDHHDGTDSNGGIKTIAIFGGHYLMPGVILRVSRIYIYTHEILVRADLMREYSFSQHVRILVGASQRVLPPWREVAKRLRYYLMEIPKPKPPSIAAAHVPIVATTSVVIPAEDGIGDALGHH